MTRPKSLEDHESHKADLAWPMEEHCKGIIMEPMVQEAKDARACARSNFKRVKQGAPRPDLEDAAANTVTKYSEQNHNPKKGNVNGRKTRAPKSTKLFLRISEFPSIISRRSSSFPGAKAATYEIP